jgi:tetratricopeptide (TPR) repeat protein
MAHHMLGNHKQALKVARRERKLNPDSIDGRIREIQALAALGKLKEVDILFNELLTLPQGDRYYADSVTPIAVVLRVNGYREASLQVLERAIKWFESRPEEEAETLFYRRRLAMALYTAERWEEAQILFENLHNEFPDSVDYTGFLGTLAARRGDRDEALRNSGLLEKIEIPYPLEGR